MKTLVCERWPLDLGQAGAADEPWYLDWVLREPSEASRHVTAGWAACKAVADVVDEIDTVHEPFGGVGAYAVIVQGLFSPMVHTVAELSDVAVRHLATIPGVTAQQADAFVDLGFGPRDLYVSDSPNFTAWQTRDGRGYRRLFDTMFGHEPKAVVFNDLAKARMHLHRQRYESMLGDGACASYEAYLHALLARLQVLYGYTLLAGYVGQKSAVMALVPEDTAPVGRLERNPTSPVGLTVQR